MERHCIDKATGKESHEIAYGITSRMPESADAKRVLATNRGHWVIENSCHYIIDWSYDEDRSRLRTDCGPEKMTWLRRFAVGLIKPKADRNVAQRMRQLHGKCLMVCDYLRMTGHSCGGTSTQ